MSGALFFNFKELISTKWSEQAKWAHIVTENKEKGPQKFPPIPICWREAIHFVCLLVCAAESVE